MEKKLLDELGDQFIGLWRYNVYGERRYWVCTVCCDGEYYDSGQRTTPLRALKEGLRVVRAHAKAKTSKRR